MDGIKCGPSAGHYHPCTIHIQQEFQLMSLGYSGTVDDFIWRCIYQ